MILGAGAVASLYFISLSTAILYPGNDYSDPEFGASDPKSITADVKIDELHTSVIALAVGLSFLGGRWLDRDS